MGDRTDGAARSNPGAHPDKVGDEVGRYRIDDVIGQGGMGIVYSAWDDRLQRRVAIKLLRADSVQAEHIARLRREAQALAQLSHDNVLTIYEVGEHEGAVFLATELIDGQALDAWLAAREHPWTEVVDVLLAAGRGLSAAHAKGLVHRDFKPANVMLATDGRVKVLDFGLARAPTRGDETEAASVELHPGITELDDALTEVGTVMGTPAYMAPEQYRLERVDTKTDQYAFCVTLFEGLFRRRAFTASSTAQLRRKIEAGDVGQRPLGPVPARVWRILRRGMAVRPEDRFDDMPTLLAALSRARHPRRARWVVGAATLGMATTALAWGGPAAVCDDGTAQWDAMWGDERRTKIGEAIGRSGLSYADSTWAQVAPQVDDYGQRWLRARADVCASGASEPDFDARMQCLDRALAGASAMLDALADADADAVVRAVVATSRLRDPVACSASSSQPTVPTELADRVAALRSDIARLEAREDAGQHDGSLQAAEQLLSTARELGYRPATAQTLALVGRMLRNAGRYDEAVAALEESFWMASEAGEERTAAGSGAVLVFVLAQHMGDLPAAQTWARHTAGAVERLGDDAPSIVAAYENSAGALANQLGQPEAAVQHYERAGDLQVAAHGRRHLDVATALGNTANALADQGKHAEAEALHREALSIRTELLGPEHPDLGRGYADLASVLADLGRVSEAIAAAERAVAVTAAGLGESHPLVGLMSANLATLYEKDGRNDEAATTYERALSAATASLGPEHLHVAIIKHNLGGLRRLQGRNDEALALLQSSHAAMVATLGERHPQVSSSLINLGLAHAAAGQLERALAEFRRAHAIAVEHRLDADALAQAAVHVGDTLRQLGRPAEAKAAHEEALAVWERTSPSDNGSIAVALIGIGEDLIAQGQPADAIAPLRRAMSVLAKTQMPGTVLADGRYALARALVAAGKDRAEARVLAAQAVSAYREAGGLGDDAAIDVERWLSRLP